MSHFPVPFRFLTPALCNAALFQKGEKIRVYNIQGPIRLCLFNHARDVDLAGTCIEELK